MDLRGSGPEFFVGVAYSRGSVYSVEDESLVVEVLRLKAMAR